MEWQNIIDILPFLIGMVLAVYITVVLWNKDDDDCNCNLDCEHCNCGCDEDEKEYIRKMKLRKEKDNLHKE